MQNNEFYLTPDTMKNMDPEELNADLIEEYVHEIPVSIETIEDMTKAGRLMGILTNNYAYLLAALYQAPTTIDSYYRAAVRADCGR